MTEIESQICNSSKNANQVNEFSGGMRISAETGVNEIDRSQSAMQEINESSK